MYWLNSGAVVDDETMETLMEQSGVYPCYIELELKDLISAEVVCRVDAFYEGYAIDYISDTDQWRIYDPKHRAQTIAYEGSYEEALNGIIENLI